MNSILLDSDSIVAQLKHGDQNYAKALSTVEKIRELKLKKYILNLVIYETATVLSYKISQDVAQQFLSNIDSAGVEIIHFEQRLEKLTNDLFITQKKKGTSYVDCANIVTMQQYKIDSIFSFDSFYGDKRF